LISSSAGMDLDLNAALQEVEAIGDTIAETHRFASQTDYISLLGLDNEEDVMDYNYLDANKDADTNPFNIRILCDKFVV
jgi:hypothetical protein